MVVRSVELSMIITKDCLVFSNVCRYGQTTQERKVIRASNSCFECYICNNNIVVYVDETSEWEMLTTVHMNEGSCPPENRKQSRVRSTTTGSPQSSKKYTVYVQAVWDM